MDFNKLSPEQQRVARISPVGFTIAQFHFFVVAAILALSYLALRVAGRQKFQAADYLILFSLVILAITTPLLHISRDALFLQLFVLFDVEADEYVPFSAPLAIVTVLFRVASWVCIFTAKIFFLYFLRPFYPKIGIVGKYWWVVVAAIFIAMPICSFIGFYSCFSSKARSAAFDAWSSVVPQCSGTVFSQREGIVEYVTVVFDSITTALIMAIPIIALVVDSLKISRVLVAIFEFVLASLIIVSAVRVGAAKQRPLESESQLADPVWLSLWLYVESCIAVGGFSLGMLLASLGSERKENRRRSFWKSVLPVTRKPTWPVRPAPASKPAEKKEPGIPIARKVDGKFTCPNGNDEKYLCDVQSEDAHSQHSTPSLEEPAAPRPSQSQDLPRYSRLGNRFNLQNFVPIEHKRRIQERHPQHVAHPLSQRNSVVPEHGVHRSMSESSLAPYSAVTAPSAVEEQLNMQRPTLIEIPPVPTQNALGISPVGQSPYEPPKRPLPEIPPPAEYPYPQIQQKKRKKKGKKRNSSRHISLLLNTSRGPSAALKPPTPNAATPKGQGTPKRQGTPKMPGTPKVPGTPHPAKPPPAPFVHVPQNVIKPNRSVKSPQAIKSPTPSSKFARRRSQHDPSKRMPVYIQDAKSLPELPRSQPSSKSPTRSSSFASSSQPSLRRKLSRAASKASATPHLPQDASRPWLKRDISVRRFRAKSYSSKEVCEPEAYELNG